MLFNVQDLLLFFSFMAVNDNFGGFRLLKRNYKGCILFNERLSADSWRKEIFTNCTASIQGQVCIFPHSDAWSVGPVFFDKPTSALSSVHSMQTFKWNAGMNIFIIRLRILVWQQWQKKRKKVPRHTVSPTHAYWDICRVKKKKLCVCACVCRVKNKQWQRSY